MTVRIDPGHKVREERREYMAVDRKTMLAAGGILAVALTIGSRADRTEKALSVPIAVEISNAVKGQEIKSLREPNREVFKADSVWVHPKGPDGREAIGDSFRAASFTARVYARPKYFRDADGDTLRPLDLTVKDISALAKLNPLKTHDKYVDAGLYEASWFAEKPGEFRMNAGTAHVKYRALFGGTGITVATEPTADGMKETVTLADSAAGEGDPAGRPYGGVNVHALRWVVETDGTLAANAAGGFDVRAKDGTVPMRIERPRAWDADGKPVMVAATAGGDTLTFRVTVLPGQGYPVTVDPTTNLNASQYGRASNSNSVYLTARNGAGNDSYSYYLNVGQVFTGSNYNIDRAFIGIPGIPGMVSASACTLFVDGYTNASDTDFDLYIVGARAWKSTLSSGDFPHFNGWVSSGTYTGTVLNNTWNTSSYSSNWNAIIFNAAGRDSLAAAAGDTLWLAMLSSRDYTPSAPTGNEYVIFAGSAPYLSFTYTPYYTTPPTGYTLHSATSSGMKASWTNRHTTGIDSLTRFTGAGAWARTLAKTDTSETITGLSPDTRYIYKARADSGGTFGYSNADTLYTLANPPVSWNFTEDYGDSTRVNIGFGTNGNPSGTVYAIRDSTNRVWISSSGDTTAVTTWRTWTEWAALGKLVNRTAAKRQRFGVVAKNGDGVMTAWAWGSLSIGNVRSAELSAVDPLTHGGRSAVYSNQRGTVDPDSIATAAFDTLGQRLSGGVHRTWRASMRFKVPEMDDAVACSLRVTGAGDHSGTDFGIMAAKGLWTGGDPDERYHSFSGWSSGVFSTMNLFQECPTTSYAATMKWPFSLTGLSRLFQARGDTLRLTLFSSRDSSATAPAGDEFIRIADPTLIIRYAKADRAPSNVVVTAIPPDSLMVTWTDNSSRETGFALVDALTGARLGGNDSTAADTVVKRMGGLDPNTAYTIAVMTLGGKADGCVSEAASPCYTLARTPGMPSIGFPARGRVSFALDPNGNPSWTLFAVQDSVTGLFVDASAEPETLRAGPPGDWGWRTYGGWGGSSGDTLSGVRPGGYHVIRAKARSGR